MRGLVAARTEELTLAAGVLLVAFFFAARQWAERRSREEELSPEDELHFARKDARRLLGTAIMTVVAVAIFAGSLINPRANRAWGRTFGWIWVGILASVCFLLILAFRDWQANLAYARRHRQALNEERRQFLRAELRRLASTGNGRGDSKDGLV